MSQVFARQLGLIIQKTHVRAQKIDKITLEIYQIVVFIFSVSDKDDKERFFEEDFLLVDIKPKIVFRMLFLTISNADVDFQVRDLQ